MRAARLTAAVGAPFLLLASCTGSSETEFRPIFRQAPCPEDVTRVVLNTVTCGFLTVLENRSEPEGDTIRLFVTRIEPPGGNPAPDPVLILGIDLGKTPDYAGFAPGAQRVNRELILLDQRGTGHSEPTLACPEVERLGERLVGARLSDPEVRADLQSAAEACHDRMTGEGIDLSAYNVGEMAADVEDVRRALGIPRWNIASYGSSSRVALEVVRRSPEHVRAMWLDTPQFPQVDGVTLGITGTRYALTQIADDCAADRVCSRRYPDLSNALQEAVVRLDEEPVTVNVADTPAAEAAGHPIRVVVDGGAFLRAVRAMVSNIDLGMAPAVPALIYRALEGDVEVVAYLLSEEPLCLGYQPVCGAQTSFEGALFSILCHDEIPFVEASRLTAMAGGDPGFQDAYVESPYLDVCEAWDVGEATSAANRPVSSDVPMLIFVGEYDAYGPLPVAEQAIASLSGSFLVDVPYQGHNVLGSLDCYRNIRNAWIENPTSAPDTSCIEEIPPPTFASRLS
jgi:pimeloyl-ACP methyl ester carboxylesterase